MSYVLMSPVGSKISLQPDLRSRIKSRFPRVICCVNVHRQPRTRHSCLPPCEKTHCIEDPFLFTKKGNERCKKNNGEEKIGRKVKAKVWQRDRKKKKNTRGLILQPPVPSFLCGWGLPGLIQQQLYNVFLPFNRLHQHTRVYSLQLQTVAVSDNSAFKLRRPAFHRHRGEHAVKEKYR